MPPKPRKRQKRSNEPQSAGQDKHTLFTQWALNQGIKINGVAPTALPGRGIGLATTKRIKADERLIFVPESAMLKPYERYQTNSQLSPQAQLSATLSAAAAAEEDDEQYNSCSAVWPTHNDFRSSLLWLDPGIVKSKITPNAKQEYTDLLPLTLRKPLERVVADFENDMESLCTQLDGDVNDLDSEQDYYHWAISNTRSFHWKPPGRKTGRMVMCPFLDYMNHCPNGQGVSSRSFP